MDRRKEQQVFIKFCANLGESATETLTMIQQAFRDQSFSRAQVFQWHAWLKTGRTSVDGDEHTGRLRSCTTPETVAQIQELVHQDRWWTIHDIAEEVGIGYGTCQWVLTEELGTHRVTAKFVPRILTADQKQQCVNVCTERCQLNYNDETFLPRVITGDQSWVYGYDPETKQKSPSGKAPCHQGQKSQRGEKQCQEHDHHFLWHKGGYAQRICPNRPNYEFWVLLQQFVATAWKRAKTSPQTLTRTDLAASPWQRPVSHVHPHPAVFGEKQNGCHPSPTVLPWFGTLWLLPISKNEIEAERTPVWYHWEDTGQITESALTLW